MNETERVALAIESADCGYSINLVRLVDGEATYEAKCAGETREFPDHQSASDWVHGFRLAAQARAAIAAMGGGDPFTTDNFAAMWNDWADADWRLVTDPTVFLGQCESAGLAECVDVDEDALDDAFAAERGIVPGGMMWRLTAAGQARYASSRKSAS